MSTKELTQDPFAGVEDTDVQLVDTTTIGAIVSSEVGMQVDVAKRYPRTLNKFRLRVKTMAEITPEVAASCMYSLPRGGKPIIGPSVRFAEICASAWTNLRIGARPLEVGKSDVTSQGFAWDLETNVMVTVESKRRITNSDGKRYNDDMIIMTQNAANSIALRNAIFRVIPRAYVDALFVGVRRVAVGDASTLVEKRAEVAAYLAKMGVDEARLLLAAKKDSMSDIGLEELEMLMGYSTSIKEGHAKVDELFPMPPKDLPGAAQGDQGRRMNLAPNGNGAKPAATATQQPSAKATASAKPAAAKAEASKPASAPPAAEATAATPAATAAQQAADQRLKVLGELSDAMFAAEVRDEAVAKWFGAEGTARLDDVQIGEAIARLKLIDDGSPEAVAKAFEMAKLPLDTTISDWFDGRAVTELSEKTRKEAIRSALAMVGG